MIYYSQSKVLFTLPDGSTSPALYAGNGQWKNDPASQCVTNHGPLPQGIYTMLPIQVLPHLGPAIVLIPNPGNSMCGRGGFRIHGIDTAFPLDSSLGCICDEPSPRQLLNSWILKGENQLTVIA
jgi:hypothetical protein